MIAQRVGGCALAIALGLAGTARAADDPWVPPPPSYADEGPSGPGERSLAPPPPEPAPDTADAAPGLAWSDASAVEPSDPVTTFLPPPVVRDYDSALAEGYDITGGMSGPGPEERPETTRAFAGPPPPAVRRDRRGRLLRTATGPSARVFEVTVRHRVPLPDGREAVEIDVVFTARGLNGRPILVGTWLRDRGTGRRVPSAPGGFADANGRLTAQSVRFVVEQEGARHGTALRLPYAAIPRRLGASFAAVEVDVQVILVDGDRLRSLATARVPVVFAGPAGRPPASAMPSDAPPLASPPPDASSPIDPGRSNASAPRMDPPSGAAPTTPTPTQAPSVAPSDGSPRLTPDAVLPPPEVREVRRGSDSPSPAPSGSSED